MTQKWKPALFTLLLGAAAWFSPAAKADEWDKLTVLTFNEAVQIPGQVLPPGTYVFKLLDSPSDRKTVQIFTEDQKQLLATILAISDYRLEPTDKTIVTFEERAAGLPQALHTWFYPGDNSGLAFVYPKAEPQIMAQAAEQAPVPEAPALAAAPEEQAIEQPAPEPPPIDIAVAREEEIIIAEPAPAPADSPLPVELPKTAGNFAIFPLLGIVLLSAGFTAFRFATKQR